MALLYVDALGFAALHVITNDTSIPFVSMLICRILPSSTTLL